MEEEDYEILSTSAKEKEDGYYYWFVNCNSSTKPTFNDNIVFSIPIHNEVVAAEVLTTIMAVLSIFGCALIIFSYIAYKDIRTKARVMLFHLSIADLIITISSLFGLYMNFIRITDEITQPPHTKGLRKASFIVNSTTDPRCYTQAAITTYGTIASLLWSNVIGIVMVVLVLKRDKSQQINHVIYVVACFVCWLLPLIIVIIDGAFRLFGFVIITSTGEFAITVDIHRSLWKYGHFKIGGLPLDMGGARGWAKISFALLLFHEVNLVSPRTRSSHKQNLQSMKKIHLFYMWFNQSNVCLGNICDLTSNVLKIV